jgi:cell division protein ZapA
MSINASIKVDIFNHTYNIRSDGDGEYIHTLAAYVDGKMREVAAGGGTADSVKIAILAALHIADELNQAKGEQQKQDDQLERRSADCIAMLDEVLKHRTAGEL